MGASSALALTGLGDSSFSDRSIVIGIDLFFWDSFESSCDFSIDRMASLISVLGRRQIPLVLGTIPFMYKYQYQPCRKSLMLAIQNQCTLAKGCMVFPVDDYYKAILGKDGLEHEGHIFHKEDLLVDDIHPSDKGSEVLAAKLRQLILSSMPAPDK